MRSVEDLKQRLDDNTVLLLDVRPAADFSGEQGHIAGALNIPLEDLPQRLDEVGRDRPIMLVCRTDRRSAQAAALLAKHGYADVHVVKNGMTAWNAQGWPVER
jgi:rhodanese-related sulfurtransferase